MLPLAHTEPISTLKIKPPPNRSPSFTGYLWLKDKRDTDGAEGLWRIHDSLYDFTEFINKHPGGSSWLEMSKGIDITAAFEVHHLSTAPVELLSKFFVRKAKTKRNSPFTFNEDGFYKTLKKEVIPFLKSAPKQAINTSAVFTDAFLLFTFLFAVLAASYWNYKLAVLSAFFMTYLTVASHNYLHKKDNFRMHYFDFGLQSYKEWRVSHVLSHHLHTNTIDDLEISNNEPFVQFLPIQKPTLYRYTHWFWFLIYCIISTISGHLKVWYFRIKGESGPFKLDDLVAYILPLTMYIFGGQSLLATLWMWLVIELISSLHFGLIGFNAAHHHPDIFHDGDTPRTHTDYDWGLSQLDAIMDRKEITGSHFLVMTHFGDHALHHLFPTLDHGILDSLYPVLSKVCEEFNVGYRMIKQWDMIKGTFRQLLREEPNRSPPDLLKKYD